MRRTILISAAVLLALAPGSTRAFSIGTSVTRWCHEPITRDAVAASNVRRPEGWPHLWPDQGDEWLEIARWLEDEGFLEPGDDGFRLLQVSLFLGVRYPDQRGFGLTDLQGMREIHLSGEDQKAHSLRSPDQDGPTGDAQALEEARSLIRELVRQARPPDATWSMPAQMKTVSVWIEFYGEVDVTVWEPAFLMGRALHTLQDSISHTYRSPDLRRVYAVANYLEALTGKYDERRDGPRHSNSFDHCSTEDAIAPLTEAAILASTELFNAGLVYMDTGDLAPVEAVLDDWLRLEPGCGYDANYCGTPWAALAKRDETRPPGCSTAGALDGPGAALLLAGLVGLRLRLRRAIAPPRHGRARCRGARRLTRPRDTSAPSTRSGSRPRGGASAPSRASS